MPRREHGRGMLRRARGDWSRSGLTGTALGALGFSLGVTITRVESGETLRSVAFASTPQFAIWSAVAGFEVAIWVICWTRARAHLAETKSRLPGPPVWPFAVVFAALLVGARSALFLYPEIKTPLYAMRPREILLEAMALFCALPAILSIWRIQAWLRSPDTKLSHILFLGSGRGRVVSDLLFARETLRRLLFVLSAIIGAGVVTTGAFRSALLANGLAPEMFPAVNVLLYGALFTAALALLYVPAHADLRQAQRRVLDGLCRLPDDGIPSADWHTARDRTVTLLQLDGGLLEAVRTVTVVLGPFLGAFTTIFVPDLKT